MASRTMKTCEVAELRIDQRGRLLVIPVDFDPRRPFIYRAASSVRWEESSNAFVAAAPEKWEYGALLSHTFHEVQGELGETLRVTARTRWTNVSRELELELTSIFRKLE